jgi:PKD repeat protein
VTVNFREIPESPFLAETMEACSYTILDAGNPGSTFSWMNGNSAANYYADSSGIYWVEITNSLGCSIRDSINLIIKPMAVLSLDSEMHICDNGSGIIDAGYYGDDYSYNWNTGSTEQFIRVTSPGTYKVEVIHAEGCSSIDSTVVTTLSSPKVDLGSNIILCKNSGLTLDGGTPGSTYFWGNSNGLYESEQVIEVHDTGTYWVYVVSPNGCTGTDSVDILHTNMSIEPLFICASNIKVGDTVRFVDLSVPEPNSYIWDFGDMHSSENGEPTHIFYSEGVFNTSLTVTNEVCSASIRKAITVDGNNFGYLTKFAMENQKSVPGLIRINKARIYPNPVRDFFNLEMEISERSNVAMYLFSISGQLIRLEKFDDIHNIEHTINISGMSEGMYILRLVTLNESRTFKILKLK